jgi:hypothetical protein
MILIVEALKSYYWKKEVLNQFPCYQKKDRKGVKKYKLDKRKKQKRLPAIKQRW